MQKLLFAGIALLGLATASHAASDHRWAVYANARFAYQICYPADLLDPQPESDNGDGRVFEASSGASLRVWGNYNVSDESLAALADGLADRGATVTYRRMAKTWSVISGRKSGEIFYAKVLLGKGKSDIVRSFILSYPESQAATFDEIAGKVSDCFAATE